MEIRSFLDGRVSHLIVHKDVEVLLIEFEESGPGLFVGVVIEILVSLLDFVTDEFHFGSV